MGCVNVKHREKLAILLLAFGFLNGLVWASVVPVWEAPDERTYFKEIKMIAEEYKVPGITGSRVTSHPQLYQVLVAPLYLAGSPWGDAGRVLAIRVFGVVIALLVAWIAYLTAGQAFPGNNFAPLVTASLFLLHPEFTFIMSSINSDVLLNVFSALFFWQSVLLVKRKISLKRIALLLLITIGGLMTKERFWFAVAILAALVPVVVVRSILRSRGEAIKQVLGRHPILIPSALLMSSLIVGFVFKELFAVRFLGVAGPAVNQAMDSSFRVSMFKYFWGHFGLLYIPMSDFIYRLLVLLMACGVLGGVHALLVLAKKIASDTDRFEWDSRRVDTLIILGLFASSAAIMYLALAGYHFGSGGGQGRYLFVVLVPIFALFSWGLSELVPKRFWAPAFWGLFGALFALNVTALYNFVIPYYY